MLTHNSPLYTRTSGGKEPEFSPDSKKLAVKSYSDRCLEVWDVQSQKLDVKVGKFDHLAGTVTPVFWTNNNENIVAAFRFTEDDETIYEFDASTLETVGTPFKGHTKHVTGLALSFDNALLASASFDNTIKLWAFESRQLLASFHVQDIFRLVLSPDSRQLAYTTSTIDNHNIYICDTPLDILAQARACIDPKHVLFVGPTLIPPSQIPSSTVGSRLPRLRPRKLLPPSSRIHSVFSTRNNESDDLPTEAILKDLSKHITKDEDYPVARGGFGEIWKCSFHIHRRTVKVCLQYCLYIHQKLIVW
jgi:WD40 repeat protein